MTFAPPAAPVLPDSPDPIDFKNLGPLSVFLAKLVNAVSRELMRRPPKDVAVDEVLLRSPNGSVYRLSVTDTGVVQTQVLFQSP